MGLERVVLSALEEKDIYDVYFCKSVLYVINEYDAPFVKEYIDNEGYPIEVTVIDEDRVPEML
jgi:hypothetical protein